MQKRILPFILAMALIIPLSFLTSFTAARASWADDMMADLVGRGVLDVISGNPNAHITREEFCVTLAKAALSLGNATLPAGDASVFADADRIKSGNAPYIMFLYEQRILRGLMISNELHMQPDALLTRQEAAAFMGRWLGLNPEGIASPSVPFTDDDTIATYARNIIYQLSDMGIISGYTDRSFRPLRNISYAETASLIHKALAGNLLLSYFGDGNLGNASGSAFEASFAMPSGVCLDNDGNLIVFDTFNAGVKRIINNTSATLLGFSSAIDDYGFIMPNYSDGESANALFGRPVDGLHAPNGDLFIVDSSNHAIRLLRGDMVYTFAGGVPGFSDGRRGEARFNSPMAIAIDNAGNLYIADTMNHCIRRIAADGTVSTVAGSAGEPGFRDGTGGAALFHDPSGIAVSESGAIYVADTGNHVIRRIDGGTVTTVAGVVSAFEDGEDYRPGGYSDGPAQSAMFNFPTGLHYANGVLFIADTGNHAVRALMRDGNVITAAGTGYPGDTDGLPGAAMLYNPTGVAYLNGVLYIADSFNNKIRMVWVDLSSLG
jgi:sugar lactone lactonase YvrE